MRKTISLIDIQWGLRASLCEQSTLISTQTYEQLNSWRYLFFQSRALLLRKWLGLALGPRPECSNQSKERERYWSRAAPTGDFSRLPARYNKGKHEKLHFPGTNRCQSSTQHRPGPSALRGSSSDPPLQGSSCSSRTQLWATKPQQPVSTPCFNRTAGLQTWGRLTHFHTAKFNFLKCFFLTEPSPVLRLRPTRGREEKQGCAWWPPTDLCSLIGSAISSFWVTASYTLLMNYFSTALQSHFNTSISLATLQIKFIPLILL